MKIILGERLKELRLEKGLTQTQLSKKFNINSVTYLHYGKSQREPPLSLISRICFVFWGFYRLFIRSRKIKVIKEQIIFLTFVRSQDIFLQK